MLTAEHVGQQEAGALDVIVGILPGDIGRGSHAQADRAP